MSLIQLLPLSDAGTLHSIYLYLINVQRVNSLVYLVTPRQTRSPKENTLCQLEGANTDSWSELQRSAAAPRFSYWQKRNKYLNHMVQIKWKLWN